MVVFTKNFFAYSKYSNATKCQQTLLGSIHITQHSRLSTLCRTMSLNCQFKNSYCFQNLFLGIPLIGCLKHSMYINVITFILFVWLTVSINQHRKCLPITWQQLQSDWPLRSWPLIPSVFLSPFPEILVNLNCWPFVSTFPAPAFDLMSVELFQSVTSLHQWLCFSSCRRIR